MKLLLISFHFNISLTDLKVRTTIIHSRFDPGSKMVNNNCCLLTRVEGWREKCLALVHDITAYVQVWAEWMWAKHFHLWPSHSGNNYCIAQPFYKMDLSTICFPWL